MPQTKRRSARVILLNEEGKVLLIKFKVEKNNKPFVFWATPGGTVENGETDFEAAKRELIEELKIDIPIEGPVHSVTSEYEHEGSFIANTDIFFWGLCNQKNLTLSSTTPSERAAMQTVQWWSIAEIEDSEETIFPADLTTVVGGLEVC